MAALDPQSTRHADDGITARAMASRRPKTFEQRSLLNKDPFLNKDPLWPTHHRIADAKRPPNPNHDIK
jgi:hypothetical protein